MGGCLGGENIQQLLSWENGQGIEGGRHEPPATSSALEASTGWSLVFLGPGVQLGPLGRPCARPPYLLSPSAPTSAPRGHSYGELDQGCVAFSVPWLVIRLFSPPCELGWLQCHHPHPQRGVDRGSSSAKIRGLKVRTQMALQ